MIGVRRMSPAHRAVTDRAKDLDRAYFRAHPLALSYRRPYIPGEVVFLPAEPTPDDPHTVVVAVVSDHLRMRAGVYAGQDPDAVAAALEATAAELRAQRPVRE